MILNDILIELRRISTALEKLADIKPLPPTQELPKNSKVQILMEEDNTDDELEKQLDIASNKGFLFPEDAVPLELLDK